MSEGQKQPTEPVKAPQQFIRSLDGRYCIPPDCRIIKVVGWEDVLSGTGANFHRVYICVVEERLP